MTQTVSPSTAQAVIEVVQAARADARTLELAASGTRRGYGRPVVADTLVDLSGLAGVVDYDPAEMVLTARPGTRLSEINALLANSGQALAFEPPDFGPLWDAPDEGGSLGGALAMGLGGPRRPSAGAPRDHILGFNAVNGLGEAFAAGGRVIKNVTGFDLPKLVAGSLGSLCVLTEVTVKTLPVQPVTRTLTLKGLSDAQAVQAMTMALNSAAGVSGAAHLPEDGLTLLRLEGVAVSVSDRVDRLRRLLADFAAEDECLDDEPSKAAWRRIAGVRAFLADPDALIWRISAPPSAAAAFTAALEPEVEGRWIYDWGGGLIWLSTPPADDAHAAVVRQALHAAAGRDGHATLFRAPNEIRSRIDVFQPLDPAMASLMGRVKQRFDPGGLFNPGRLYGSL